MLLRSGEMLDQKFLSLKQVDMTKCGMRLLEKKHKYLQFCQTQFENFTNLIFTMRLLTFIVVCVAFLAVSATAQDTPDGGDSSDGGDGSDGGDQPDSGDGS
jgi:hypothetical protein